MNERTTPPVGSIIAIVVAPATAKTQNEWDAAIAKMWEPAMADLRTHKGFRGAIALWNHDAPGTATVLGFWASMEDRLRYEADSTKARTTFFEGLYAEPPKRTRYEITRVTLLP